MWLVDEIFIDTSFVDKKKEVYTIVTYNGIEMHIKLEYMKPCSLKNFPYSLAYL